MKKYRPLLYAMPMYIFVLLFVAFPLLYVLYLSFLSRDDTLNLVAEFTLDNYKKMLDPMYIKIFADSLRMAFVTTLITALIGYPFGYFMAKLTPKARNIVMMFVIVPFWTNALVRIYGWIIFLRGSGVLSSFLMTMGLAEEPLNIMYTETAVYIGMVYALLPFMILSVYSSCLKIDGALLDASRDLGAGRVRTFFKVSLPLTMPGLLSGVVLVFIPSMGLFFISDLLGGGKIMLLGNLIKNQLTTSRNLPFGAALSVVMMILTLSVITAYRKITHTSDIYTV